MTYFLLYFVLPVSEPQDEVEAKKGSDGGWGRLDDRRACVTCSPARARLWLGWIPDCTEQQCAALNSRDALGHTVGSGCLRNRCYPVGDGWSACMYTCAHKFIQQSTCLDLCLQDESDSASSICVCLCSRGLDFGVVFHAIFKDINKGMRYENS